MSDVAFYCTSSELYFPGAVGLVNSLRMAGHDEPIHVLDCGLTDAHRLLLEREANVLPAPDDTPPYLLKTVAPLRHPCEVMLLIDVDMVVARSLRPLIDGAEDGVVAVKDNIDRFVPEWGELLDLGTARPRPYVSSGLVALGGPTGRRVLELWDDRQRRVDYDASYFERDERDYPFRYIDQDVLNAVLCTTPDPDRVTTLDPALAPVPPFRRVRPLDSEGLRCVDADGTEPYVIHQFVRKPWLEPMYHGIYSELLRRAWLSPRAPLRYPPEEIPLRMRSGLLARLERRRVDAFDLARWYVRDVIPEWIETRRRRRAGATR
jgi:hypothetical protein